MSIRTDKCSLERWSLGWCATTACVWEVTAPKPGNVYRGADFDDVTYEDFVQAAHAIGPVIERATQLDLGEAVLHAVRATRDAVGTNTNLGTLLLIAPLACAFGERNDWRNAAIQIVESTTARDTALVYEAIRTASPGGMGKVDQGDISESAPSVSLLEAMRMAAERDTIALQYVNSFAQVWEAADLAFDFYSNGESLSAAIVRAHVVLMSRYADSLIARKCGAEIAAESMGRAAALLELRAEGQQEYSAALAEFDAWLRADGHRRNPGTTADLIAAGLFVLLVEKRITLPVRFN
ncbi:MAG: triphosphoribosyl-dephospho-CoA synthase [Pirellulales bacterium]